MFTLRAKFSIEIICLTFTNLYLLLDGTEKIVNIIAVNILGDKTSSYTSSSRKDGTCITLSDQLWNKSSLDLDKVRN